MECCNYTCDNPTFGKRIRCGICRKYSRFQCCDCGEPSTERGLMCTVCRDNHVQEYQNQYYGITEKFCTVCHVQLDMNRTKLCGNKECHRTYWNKYWRDRRRGKKVSV